MTPEQQLAVIQESNRDVEALCLAHHELNNLHLWKAQLFSDALARYRTLRASHEGRDLTAADHKAEADAWQAVEDAERIANLVVRGMCLIALLAKRRFDEGAVAR